MQTRRRFVAFMVFVCVTELLSAQPNSPKVRVYIWTAHPEPGVLGALDQKEREEAVTDLRIMLGRVAKKELELAPKDASQIQVEVTKRSATLIRATLRVEKEYSTELDCRNEGRGGWLSAAGDCIAYIKKWVGANRAQFK